MIYSYMFPEPSIASRERGIGKLPTHIPEPEGRKKLRRKKKGKRGHHNVPEIEGQLEKVP